MIATVVCKPAESVRIGWLLVMFFCMTGVGLVGTAHGQDQAAAPVEAADAANTAGDVAADGLPLVAFLIPVFGTSGPGLHVLEIFMGGPAGGWHGEDGRHCPEH